MRRKPKKDSAGVSVRQRKVSEFLRQRISEILQLEDYEELTGIITITRVEVSADLRHAKVWFSSVGQDPDNALRSLNHHLYDIQGQIYRSVTMRIIPKVAFFVDDSGDYSNHISKLLRDIKDEK